jgi:hypothetical protein
MSLWSSRGLAADARAPAHWTTARAQAAPTPLLPSNSTFSDANWVSLGGLPGAIAIVSAAAIDETGNLYIGGPFNVVGQTLAHRVAKWDGLRWSALGDGVQEDLADVSALAVFGANLYIGGAFGSVGGVPAFNVARWDGTNWSALGQGLDGPVGALAVAGNQLYVGGLFTIATNSDGSTVAVNRLARWDGAHWSALV